MSTKFADVIWPNACDAAIAMYLDLLVNVIEELNIEFPDNSFDPILLTKMRLNRDLSNETLGAAVEYWWKYIDDRNAIRNFQDQSVLKARVALCLLAVNDKDSSELNQHLSWFFEVLEFLGHDWKSLRSVQQLLTLGHSA